jgi:antitoxin ParD1/3/4
MSVAKLSVSLPDSLAGFVEDYRKKRGLKSRSQVFEEALKLLRSQELEAAYREADSKHDKAWDNALSDGLSDETW